MRFPLPYRPWCLLLLVALLLPVTSGCVGLAAHLLYMINGRPIKAAFPGMEGKRVAVVCISNSSAMGPGTEARLVAQSITLLLNKEVPDIELVHPDEVANWMDNNDWDQVDYREIGRGVRADLLLAVELDRFRLYEGSTIFRGRADLRAMVLDMKKDGLVVFERESQDYSFPSAGGHHTTDSTESKFRRAFIRQLARHVARNFYDYDMVEEFGPDADMSGF